MRLPDWQQLGIKAGVLPEPVPGRDRLVLWVPRARSGGFQFWERVATLAGADAINRNGLACVEAAAVRVRQRLVRVLARLFRRETAQEPTWLLPNGHSAEQCGERREGLWLAWSTEGQVEGLAQVRALWPEGSRVEQLGANLFLVESGPAAHAAAEALASTAPGAGGVAREIAIGMNSASSPPADDLRRRAAALTDEAVSITCKGQVQRAFSLLEQALALARQLGDGSVESDVLGQMGQTAQRSAELPLARQCYELSLAAARAAGQPFQEKLALERLGTVYFQMGEVGRAYDLYEQALALARSVGDPRHAGELLWYLAILDADAGRPERSLSHGRAAIAIFVQIGHPQAAAFADHLRRYELGERMAPVAAPAQSGYEPFPESHASEGSATGAFATPDPGRVEAVQGPGLLRMALSLAKSMARYVGSGMRTVPAEVSARRLKTCADCPHHTGNRCRLCGCFTKLKTQLPHERCPLGRWPA